MGPSLRIRFCRLSFPPFFPLWSRPRNVTSWEKNFSQVFFFWCCFSFYYGSFLILFRVLFYFLFFLDFFMFIFFLFLFCFSYSKKFCIGSLFDPTFVNKGFYAFFFHVHLTAYIVYVSIFHTSRCTHFRYFVIASTALCIYLKYSCKYFFLQR